MTASRAMRGGLISLLGVLCLALPVSDVSAQLVGRGEASLVAQGAQVPPADSSVATVSPAAAASIRREIPSLAIAVIVIAIGFGSVLLFFVQREARDTALVSFGVFSLLYGARLFAGAATTRLVFDIDGLLAGRLVATITYWINVPAVLFVERIFGAGWRSTVRRLWQIWLLFAVCATPVVWTLGNTPELMRINNMLVIGGLGLLIASVRLIELPSDRRVVRVLMVGIGTLVLFALSANLSGLGLLPWPQAPEEVGFLVFIGCLAYVVAVRQLQSERRLLSIEQELKTARQIQMSILPRELPALRGMDVSARYVPMTAVGGDFYDFLPIDDRRLGILVADVSGHGVPAALIASMVKVAIASQSQHAADPSRVLSELNRTLCGKLEHQFVTATYVYIDLAAGRLTGASAGHPPTLLWRAADRSIVEVAASGLMLGHFPGAGYEVATADLGKGDRLLLYTDGIIEATNSLGEFFDPEGLRLFLADRHELSAHRLGDSLLRHLSSWSGRDPDSGGFDDDLTLVVASVTADRPLPTAGLWT